MTGQGLFRSKAVQAQGNKLDGDVIIAQPVSTTLLTACLLLAVGILLLFLAISSFHRKEQRNFSLFATKNDEFN